MNKTRLLKMVIGSALIVTAIVALQAFNPASGAKESSRFYAGMGDLRHFEVPQSIPDTGAQASSRFYVGMGDLRRFEVQQEIHNIGGDGSPSP
jgi:hypothetical protein